MRIASVSDIHGNLTALEAVIKDLKATGVDLIVHGGDLVGGGCRSADVVDLVSNLGWPGVLGNTDEVLWRPAPLEELAKKNPALQPLWELVFTDVAWTRDAVGEKRLQWLRNLPNQWGGHGVTIVHASPGDVWKAPLPTADDDELARVYGGLKKPLAVYGHIHQPYVRPISGLVVANSGSVSQSYDGDPRASYLLIEDGRPMVRRVEYDIEAEIKELAARHHPHHEWLAATLRTGKYLPPFERV